MQNDFNNLDEKISQIVSNPKKGSIPELWDGKAAETIAAILVKSLKAS